MTFINLILGILCAYRITQVIVYDTIFERPIGWLCRKSAYFEGLLTCPHCTGFWASVFTMLVIYFSDRWPKLILIVWAFGLSGGVSLIEHAGKWLELDSYEHPPIQFIDPDTEV